VDQDGIVETYSHSPLGALTDLDRLGTEDDESYNYDAMGNRTSDHRSASYTYDSSYRLLESDQFSYVWDGDGNLLSKEDNATGEITLFTWDTDSYLSGVTQLDPGGSVVSEAAYYYDPLGRRIARVIGNQSSSYTYDGPNLLEVQAFDFPAVEFPSVIRYLHGVGVDAPLWQLDQSGAIAYFVRDAKTNVVALVDDVGAVVAQYSYDAYGRRTEIVPAPQYQPLGFQGRILDPESGLYNFRRRYYDPDVGRFTSADAHPGDIRSARTLNPYLFGLNNPLLFGDLGGEFPGKAILGAAVTACLIGCLKANGAISVDSDGNLRVDFCVGVGVGLGGGGSVEASVGDGSVTTKATFEASLQGTGSVSAALGPCEVGVSASATVKSANLLSPCGGDASLEGKGEAKAECSAGDLYSDGIKAQVTYSDGVHTGGGEGTTKEKFGGGDGSSDIKAKAKVKAEASAIVQVCAGGGF
jgi:RHS repeat-associated protein